MPTLAPRGIHRRTAFRITTALRLRLLRKIERRGPDECWPWTGAVRNGYGAIKHNGKVLGTHCVAYVLANGSIPDGQIVRHSCDNRLCCNPAHLLAGDPRDNVLDMIERRQWGPQRGEECPNARLTEDKVREIRRLSRAGNGPRSLARRYGVNEATIRGVISGKTWKHVV